MKGIKVKTSQENIFVKHEMEVAQNINIIMVSFRRNKGPEMEELVNEFFKCPDKHPSKGLHQT